MLQTSVILRDTVDTEELELPAWCQTGMERCGMERCGMERCGMESYTSIQTCRCCLVIYVVGCWV